MLAGAAQQALYLHVTNSGIADVLSAFHVKQRKQFGLDHSILLDAFDVACFLGQLKP